MGPIAITTYGQLEGSEDDGVLRFAGVPFAQPPVGPLRFRPPRPPAAWSGVRPATAFGATSWQGPSLIDALLGGPPEPSSEDCLYLNVFTPALDDGARPVLVWIHGGAFFQGSGSFRLYDGSELVRRGDVVVVSINYRLAELGFSYLEHLDPSYAGSANCGILDQVAALEWVRDEIAGFGGDPTNVTIFGESAGGMSVGALLATPAAAGLFRRAVAQSGAASNVIDTRHARHTTTAFLARAGIETVAELAELAPEKLLEARAGVIAAAMGDLDRTGAGDGSPLGMPWQPVHDGSVIPERALDAIAAGSAAGVSLLVGSNLEEWNLFALLDPVVLDEAALEARTRAVLGEGAAAAIRTYRDGRGDLAPKAAFAAIATDYVFRIPALRLAEAQSKQSDDVFLYTFAWRSTGLGGLLGAAHAIELPFVFHRVGDPALVGFLGEGAPVELADQVQDAWIAFARTGDPNHPGLPPWPRYDLDRRATLTFDVPCVVLDDPDQAERQVWDDVL